MVMGYQRGCNVPFMGLEVTEVLAAKRLENAELKTKMLGFTLTLSVKRLDKSTNF
jgi:hypothetical protein